MAQYPIPQFIEAEGKIISFLTFRQFFWLVGGGGACLAFYYTLPFFLFVILSLLVAGFIALVAFVKIDTVPVTTIFLNFLTFSAKSKNYVWKKKKLEYPFETKNMQEPGTREIGPSKIQNVKQIVEYRKKV